VKDQKFKSEMTTSEFARAVGTYEAMARQLDKKGVVTPLRDRFGNRLFSAAEVAKARAFLSQRSRSSESV